MSFRAHIFQTNECPPSYHRRLSPPVFQDIWFVAISKQFLWIIRYLIATDNLLMKLSVIILFAKSSLGHHCFANIHNLSLDINKCYNISHTLNVGAIWENIHVTMWEKVRAHIDQLWYDISVSFHNHFNNFICLMEEP